MLHKGDMVTFKKIVDRGDEKVVMQLLEDPDGDRVLVQALVGMEINPTYVYPVEDLEKIGSDAAEKRPTK